MEAIIILVGCLGYLTIIVFTWTYFEMKLYGVDSQVLGALFWPVGWPCYWAYLLAKWLTK